MEGPARSWVVAHVSHPPRIWQLVLRSIVHHSEQQFVEGDLEETFHEIEGDYGSRRARQWYRSQVLRSIPGFLLRTTYWSLEMTKNYLLLALRNLRKSLGFMSINITGLAVGIACTIIIGLFAISELSFDTHHEQADRIMRVVRTSNFTEVETRSPITAAPLGPMFTANFPEITNYFRLQKRRADIEMRVNGRVFSESDVYDADASILDILNIPAARPMTADALEQAYRLLLSESVAERMFGTQDPQGQTIQVLGSDYVVDGVFRDFPATSHFRPSVLLSFETLVQTRPGVINHMGNNFFHTYLLLNAATDRSVVDAKFPAAIEAVAGPEVASRIGFHLQPMLDIHLHSHMDGELEPNGSVETLLILGMIALFILILAIVNFINLSTARSARRAREVGVRKAVGAHRTQVISQFLGETIMLSALALLVGLGMTFVFEPIFSELAGRPLDLSLLVHPGFLAGLVGFVLFVGLLSGFYPALVLARFNPVVVLKGDLLAGQSGSSFFRRALVVFQFTVSIVLIVGTLIVNRQLSYLQDRPLGFDEEQVLVTRMRTPEMRRSGATLISEFERQAGVEGVTASSSLLGNGAGGVLLMPEGVESGEDGVSVAMLHVRPGFSDLMDVSVLNGRRFDPDRPADLDEAFLINRTAALRMGWTASEAVGRSIVWPSSLDGSTPDVMEGRVVGVLDDFHFQSLHTQVEPLVLVATADVPSYIMTRVRTEDLSATMQGLEQAWAQVYPDDSFEAFFLDDHFNNLYAAEERSARMFRLFSLLAIALAGLGLLGLASYSTSRRTREIGIRKVMGASSTSILRLLVSEFVILVSIAFVIASPIAWYIMRGWLSNFPYRVGVEPQAFLMAGAAALILTVVTVGYHATRAAWSDPIETIRYE